MKCYNVNPLSTTSLCVVIKVHIVILYDPDSQISIPLILISGCSQDDGVQIISLRHVWALVRESLSPPPDVTGTLRRERWEKSYKTHLRDGVTEMS